MPIGQMADLFKTNISANEINLPRGQGTLSERECVSLLMAGKCFIFQLVVFRASALLKCIIMAESASGQNAGNPVF